MIDIDGVKAALHEGPRWLHGCSALYTDAMRALHSLALIGLLSACNTESSSPPDPAEDGDARSMSDEPSSAGDGERQSEGGPAPLDDRDGSSPPLEAPSKPSFEECAAKRVESERKAMPTNIVWVIDSSGSMLDEAELVQQNLNAFVRSLDDGGLSDYRVVILSEGGFVAVPPPLSMDPVHFRYLPRFVDSTSGLSAPLDHFLDLAQFLLADAFTHFIVVSDDDSRIKADDFVTRMTDLLRSPFRVHAIASPPGESETVDSLFGPLLSACEGPYGSADDPGVEIYRAAELTNGRTFSICSEDWAPLFSELAVDVQQSALPCVIELPSPSAGEQLNPDLVNVVYSPAEGEEQALPRARDRDACGDERGWHYDDPSAPSQVVLCPATCSAASTGGALDIVLGCDTVLLI